MFTVYMLTSEKVDASCMCKLGVKAGVKAMTAFLSACLANVDHDWKHVLDLLERFEMTISRTMWDNVGL